MKNNGSIIFHSHEPILKALASIPAEMANRVQGDYYITNVDASPSRYVYWTKRPPDIVWEIEVEFYQS